MNRASPEPLWTPTDDATYLRVPVQTLYQWRRKGVGPSGTSPRCVVTTSDRAGRLADRSLMRDMGWCRRTGVRFDVWGDVILVHADMSSTSSITTQGHLRLPLAVRRRSRIDAGTRVLLVAWPETGTLAACKTARVAEMVLARVSGAGAGSGERS